MSQLPLHHDATARTLAAARVYVMLLWLVKMVTLDLAALGYLSPSLFHPFGLMKLLPHSVIVILTMPSVLAVIKWLTVGLLLLSLAGIGRNRTILAVASMLVLCFGLAKGFGGHVNHRELVLLYITWFMVWMPCCEA